MGFANPFRIAITPAIIVVETAPMPGTEQCVLKILLEKARTFVGVLESGRMPERRTT